jgi:hypothetical protein
VLSAVGAAIEVSDQLMMGNDLGSSALPSGSKGTGRHRNLGKGPGDGGGVKRQERWEIVFDQGQTESEYARQLDFFNVKLGAIVAGQLFKVSRLAANRPTVEKMASAQAEKELYFSWRGGNRRQFDINLLKKAPDVPLAGNVLVLQFYPFETEQTLARLERDHLQKLRNTTDMRIVRKTKFAIVKKGNGYEFQIAKIEFLGEPPSKA